MGVRTRHLTTPSLLLLSFVGCHRSAWGRGGGNSLEVFWPISSLGKWHYRHGCNQSALFIHLQWRGSDIINPWWFRNPHSQWKLMVIMCLTSVCIIVCSYVLGLLHCSTVHWHSFLIHLTEQSQCNIFVQSGQNEGSVRSFFVGGKILRCDVPFINPASRLNIVLWRRGNITATTVDSQGGRKPAVKDKEGTNKEWILIRDWLSVVPLCKCVSSVPVVWNWSGFPSPCRRLHSCPI